MVRPDTRRECTPVFNGPAFLMCPPTLYEVDYVINPWMAGNVHRASRERAAAQWEQLHDAVESRISANGSAILDSMYAICLRVLRSREKEMRCLSRKVRGCGLDTA
jgi:hypothetical protein